MVGVCDVSVDKGAVGRDLYAVGSFDASRWWHSSMRIPVNIMNERLFSVTSRIRIGVVGGGIASITVAIALVKHPHVDVEVYESAPRFSERGAGIGLSPVTLEALDDILPSAIEVLKTPAGWWDCRRFVPLEEARSAIGDESFKVDHQYAWLGEGAAMLHGFVENRTMVQCIHCSGY
ncbi:uncharacterized protein F4812DRAFT_419425 [Daldinia caldariorum]|uniref:uncharacterized protein n=1 Tax=Daldinia caldariorum TaxID=326644 RepID=UPI0020083BCB|nr:uncharacterized protein F4812DRAFT_419425 [Daldinia caldariorum]KAI1470903.1 hypothetical protein F4812DRAFT_419425 [Daldinia caldariorum]